MRLAVAVSAVAAVVAVALTAFGDVSQTALVVAVIVIGFALSWVQTGRVQRDDRRTHRITAVRVRRPVA